MTFETGTATTQEDLLSKLSTFLTGTPGWTQDTFDTGAGKQLAVHKGTVFVQFRWSNNATPGNIGIYHSLGYTGGNAPGAHPNDSGNGDVVGVVDVERMVNNIGNGPFPAYHFFASGSYFHAVLEFATGQFRHFGAGILTKVGTWTGGEYCYGTFWDQAVAALNVPLDTRHTVLLDALTDNSSVLRTATVHCEGLPDQGGTGKWGVCFGGSSPGNDRAAVARVALLGGMRDGYFANAFNGFQANPNNGFVPMYPVQCLYRLTSGSPTKIRLLGSLPDVRGINTAFINAGEEFTVGGQTWKVFPWVRKNALPASTEGSGNLGIAYRKIT